MSSDRRALLSGFAGAAALAPFLALEKAMAQTAPPNLRDVDASAAAAHVRLMEVPGLNMHGTEQVAMLLYPGFTALDLVGPGLRVGILEIRHDGCNSSPSHKSA